MAKKTSIYDSDRTSIIALLVTFILLGVAINYGGNLLAFFDVASVLIVLCGTFTATITCFGWNSCKGLLGTVKEDLMRSPTDIRKVVTNIFKVAEVVFHKGHLALKNHTELTNGDPVLKEICALLMDGAAPAFVKQNIQQKSMALVENKGKVIEVLRQAAEIAPSMGLIGTLIGLVHMLGSFEDISKIGTAMATALLTTLYGSVVAYLVLHPLASKIESNTKHELIVVKLYMETAVAIAKKENPRQLEIIINNILPEDQQVSYFKD